MCINVLLIQSGYIAYIHITQKTENKAHEK